MAGVELADSPLEHGQQVRLACALREKETQRPESGLIPRAVGEGAWAWNTTISKRPARRREGAKEKERRDDSPEHTFN